ncbi:alpha/beta hydrolase [Haloglycomyces albus]|uniref:alpha/beta hydrolase n=1 Tax=Haloglycomyces albus TaxID=526067 RepID=UPI00046CF875|nr:alpha/beta hydrolase [Haloglycomyces albus]
MPQRRQAVILPGRNYGSQGPLFMFSQVALRSRGAHIYPMRWENVDYLCADTGSLMEGVNTQVERLLPQIDFLSSPPVLVGKSIGTAAVSTAARFELPAIWFSPLLTEYPIVQALRRCTAPYLLVGGTEDPTWESALVDELPGEICEIPGGDHGLFLPGRPLTSSAHALADIIEAVEMFLDTKVWRRGFLSEHRHRRCFATLANSLPVEGGIGDAQ